MTKIKPTMEENPTPTSSEITLEQIEFAEQELVTEIDNQRHEAYDQILQDNLLAKDPQIIRERFRWIGYEIWCLGKTEFQRILNTPFEEMHNHGIFPGPDRIWQLLYARVVMRGSSMEGLPTPPVLLQITDLHQGFAPPNTNRGDNFFGVSYEMLLQRGTAPDEYLQPKPIHQYWVQCNFAPEFFRGCWLPELLMRTYPPYVKELNRRRQLAIDELVQDAINACNKRLALMGSSLMVPPLGEPETSSSPPDTETKVLPAPALPTPDPIKVAVQLWENGDLLGLHLKLLNKLCHNVMECLLHERNTEAQLFAELDGDPLVVIGAYLVAMKVPTKTPAVIKQVVDKKLSMGPTDALRFQPGLRCLVAGFPRAVWLPVSLFAWIASRECHCGVGPYETCQCKWHNCYVAYDFVDRLLRG